MQNKVSTFLWFESGAEAAAKLYCSIFKHSKVTGSSPMSIRSVSEPGQLVESAGAA